MAWNQMSTGPTHLQLLDEVHTCRRCADDLPVEPRPVLQFHPAARILIAGQAPGRRVHESGVPFDDPSGDRLRDWMGLTREVFYDELAVAILPMGFCYPGSGASGDLPPKSQCAATWRQMLLERLVNVKLTLVIGKYALRWHLPEAHGGVTEIVRDWQRHRPRMLPLPHPSPRNNIWLRKNPWFEVELLPYLRRRVRRVLRG